MRMMHRLSTAGMLAMILAAPVNAQQVIINSPPAGEIQMPGMPGPRQFKTGTGRIRGRVFSAEGAPLRRAQVRISGNEVAPRASLTDTNGTYEFRDLPAGRFTLTATKSGYVSVQFGQTRPFESGKPIELADKQTLDKADIVMPRGSVIAGRIVDEFGEPVPDAAVSALRSTWSGGRRRLQNAGRTATTNDLGQYRLFGLPPGEYYVSATLRGGEVMMLDIVATRLGGADPSASTPSSGYAPTYFPGTASGTEAQKIALAPGQEAQGTDFALLPVRLAKITGNVINSDGKPVEGAIINAMPRQIDGGGGAFMPHSTRTDRYGNFTLSGVTPGDYTLQTRSMQIMSSGDGNTMVFSTRVSGGPGGMGGDSEFGSVPVSVSGEDVSNVMIVTSKGTVATGRVTFEGGAAPSNIAAMRIMAMPVDGEPVMFNGGGPGQVTAEGTFELRGLAGLRSIRVMNPPQGWMLKSVRLQGNDVTDSGVDFKPGDAVSGLEITMTSRLTDVSGIVKGTDGSPAKDYTVMIFSDDPQKWAAPMNRHVVSARPDQEGRYRARNLPAGDYYAIAVEYIEQGAWGDPELLERLKTKAKRFSLAEGETKTLDLELAGSTTP